MLLHIAHCINKHVLEGFSLMSYACVKEKITTHKEDLYLCVKYMKVSAVGCRALHLRLKHRCTASEM